MKHPAIYLHWMVGLLLLAACGSAPQGVTASPCDDYQGQATSDEIARTPRENSEAERLAVEATGRLTAPEAVYTRVVRELSLIRAAFDEVQGIGIFPSWPGNQLIAVLTPEGASAVEAKTYTAWDCPNAHYRVTGIQENLDSAPAPYVILLLKGFLNIPLLVQEYAQFTGIQSASPNHVAGDGNDLCLSIQGETHFYIFDAGSGDCPSGCIDHLYRGFSVDVQENITVLGKWKVDYAKTPEWVRYLSACSQWL